MVNARTDKPSPQKKESPPIRSFRSLNGFHNETAGQNAEPHLHPIASDRAATGDRTTNAASAASYSSSAQTTVQPRLFQSHPTVQTKQRSAADSSQSQQSSAPILQSENRSDSGYSSTATAPPPLRHQPLSMSQQRALRDSECFVNACDYMRHRLTRANYDWTDCPTLPEPTRARLALRTLGAEFERRYNDALNSMVEELHVTPATAYPTFMQVAQGLFQDGVNWGRIVALHSFGGALAAQCVQAGMPQLVQSVADWVAVYVEAQLDDWIQDNGGWETGLVEFYEKGRASETGWPDWKRVMTGIGAVAGVVGAVTLGRIISSSR